MTIDYIVFLKSISFFQLSGKIQVFVYLFHSICFSFMVL